MNNINERSDLQEIIDNALSEMAEDAGENFDIRSINLAVNLQVHPNTCVLFSN